MNFTRDYRDAIGEAIFDLLLTRITEGPHQPKIVVRLANSEIMVEVPLIGVRRDGWQVVAEPQRAIVERGGEAESARLVDGHGRIVGEMSVGLAGELYTDLSLDQLRFLRGETFKLTRFALSLG